MASIHVGFSQLKRSFNRMRVEALKGNLPHNYLLLFYAAECSLKAVLIRSKGVRTTAGMDDLTHNFSSMLRDLKIPPTLVSSPPRFKLQGDASKSFEAGVVHQAWRYGADVDSLDEAELVRWLQAVCVFAEGRI